MLQSLILATAAIGKVHMLGEQRCSLVAIGRDAEFAVYALGQCACQRGTLLQCDVSQGDERKHVGGPYAWMFALMVTHINEFSGTLHHTVGSLHDGIGRADERYHRTVGSLSPVDMQYANTTDRGDGLGDGVDVLDVASLTEVGYALNQVER